jgi:hypothetical protein
VHVHERPAETDVARELAHVDPAGRQRGEDPQAMGVRQSGQGPDEFVTSTVFHV